MDSHLTIDPEQATNPKEYQQFSINEVIPDGVLNKFFHNPIEAIQFLTDPKHSFDEDKIVSMKWKGPIVFVSDMHLQKDIEKSFIKQLKSIAEVSSKDSKTLLVIAGDMFQGTNLPENMFQKEEFRNLWKDLREKCFIVLESGNHDTNDPRNPYSQSLHLLKTKGRNDYITKELLKEICDVYCAHLLLEHEILAEDPKKYFVTHGNMLGRVGHDDYPKDSVWSGKLASTAEKFFNGMVSPRLIRSKLEGMGIQINQRTRNWASKYLLPGVQLISGHTHFFEEYNNGINLGSFQSEMPKRILLLITKDGIMIPQYIDRGSDQTTKKFGEAFNILEG